MAVPHTPPRNNHRIPNSCKTHRSGPYWVLESSLLSCHSAQPALGGSRSKLNASQIHPVSSPTPTPKTHAMYFEDSQKQFIPNLVEEEDGGMLNTPPAAQIFFGTPGTAERQVVQRLDPNSSIGTVYERPTPPLPTTPDSSPGVGRVASSSWELVEHRSILRDALGDVSNTNATRFSPKPADIYQTKCTKPSCTSMQSSSARSPESLTPVQSVLQDWASSTFAFSRTSPMKPSPRKRSPIRLQKQDPQSGSDVFSSPSAPPANQPITHCNDSSSATPTARTTSSAPIASASGARRVPVVPENRIHAQRVPNLSRSVPSPFAKPSKASLVPAARVPALRSTAYTVFGTAQGKSAPEKPSRAQRLPRYASHVPATRVWDSPEKFARKRARITESSQSIPEDSSHSKQAAEIPHQNLRKDLQKASENSAQNSTTPPTPFHSSSLSRRCQNASASPIHSISPSKPCVVNSSTYPQASSISSEATEVPHKSANEASEILEQQDAHTSLPYKTREAVKPARPIIYAHTDSHNRLSLSKSPAAPAAPTDQPKEIFARIEKEPIGKHATRSDISSNETKDASQAAQSARASTNSTASACNSLTTIPNSIHTGSARNLRTSARIRRNTTPAPLPMSAADLARITAKNTKQNEQYSIDLRTQEYHLAGPRPPSPSQTFHMDARPREPHWQRAHHVETNERGEPVRHARGAGDTEEYTTPPHQGRSIHWDKRLVVSPSLKPAQRRPGTQHACLVPARTTLDSLGNVQSERVPNLRRQSVVVKRVVYENDDVVDSDDDDDSL